MFLIPYKASGGIRNDKKSGILNKKVTSTTPLNTFWDAYFSGSTFNTINTMAKGYINIKAGKATSMVDDTSVCPIKIPIIQEIIAAMA